MSHWHILVWINTVLIRMAARTKSPEHIGEVARVNIIGHQVNLGHPIARVSIEHYARERFDQLVNRVIAFLLVM